MIYADVLKELARRVDALDARRQAALFWLLGSGLLLTLRPPESWTRWIEEARTLGYRYVVAGEVVDDVSGVWERAQSPTDSDSSQLLNSTVLCLSTPLGLAAGRCETVGAWVEHALFPLMQQESVRLFGDVAFSDDDEELDLVFAQPRVQQAIAFCRSALRRLEALSAAPGEDFMEELLPAAAYVSPRDA